MGHCMLHCGVHVVLKFPFRAIELAAVMLHVVGDFFRFFGQFVGAHHVRVVTSVTCCVFRFVVGGVGCVAFAVAEHLHRVFICSLVAGSAFDIVTVKNIGEMHLTVAYRVCLARVASETGKTIVVRFEVQVGSSGRFRHRFGLNKLESIEVCHFLFPFY